MVVWSVTMRSGSLGVGSDGGRRAAARGRRGSSSRGSQVIASRTRTHRTLTVQRASGRRRVACSGSSEAQIIGAIGPSSARSTSLIRIASGGARELVAAVGAAGADDEAGFAQAHDELLEVGARQVLLGGDLREARRARSRSAGRAGPSAGRRTRPSCEKETAPEPWNAGRAAACDGWVREGSSISE